MMGYEEGSSVAKQISPARGQPEARSSQQHLKPSRIQRQTALMEAPNEAVAAEIKSSVVADNNVDDEVS